MLSMCWSSQGRADSAEHRTRCRVDGLGERIPFPNGIQGRLGDRRDPAKSSEGRAGAAWVVSMTSLRSKLHRERPWPMARPTPAAPHATPGVIPISRPLARAVRGDARTPASPRPSGDRTSGEKVRCAFGALQRQARGTARRCAPSAGRRSEFCASVADEFASAADEVVANCCLRVASRQPGVLLEHRLALCQPAFSASCTFATGGGGGPGGGKLLLHAGQRLKVGLTLGVVGLDLPWTSRARRRCCRSGSWPPFRRDALALRSAPR